MSAVPSKSSLVRVASKATPGSSHKKPKFSHNYSIEKGTSSSAPQVVALPVGLPPPSIVNLEADLEAAPTFDECVKDLSCHILEGSGRGKEKLQPSLLANEEEVVTYLQSVISDQDLRSPWPNNTNVLAMSTFFDLGKVKCFFLFFFLEFGHSIL